ncbi:Rna polymerase ii c-terminal domain phosphatase-like [Thalictrum thalictroides]|uniref:RNA polymerase II C-terminal domain phosphatase-like n=1 Tax=Thalictrum thalictroides TaxID=46969 RepID=A0A7J6VF81_THATH|nr:Rna polymerase ii c-terminal domain phosphatase-like [Thalictrum thalictroides]
MPPLFDCFVEKFSVTLLLTYLLLKTSLRFWRSFPDFKTAVPELDVYVKMEKKCSHVFVQGICGNCGCGQRIDTICASQLGYIHKDYNVSIEDRDRIREFGLKNMLEKKKLYLILDLDHTLVHSVRKDQLSPDEKHLWNETNSLQDISNGSLCRFDSIKMITKLRPFARTFLKEVSDMYEMYIYTRGSIKYALNVAKLLDPGRNYFGSRVISRDDCSSQEHGKNLDKVLAAENAVVILDDEKSAWSENRQNLVIIQKYYYFAYKNKNVTPFASMKDRSESDTGLIVSLNILKHIHQMFFDGDVDEDFKNRDVREVMKRAQAEMCHPDRRVQAEAFIFS